MRFAIIVSVLLCASITHAQGTSCAFLLDSCDYYRCKQSELQCPLEDNYLLNFGDRYCRTLSQEVRPVLSFDGQVWMDQAARCLRATLEDWQQPSCNELHHFAVSSHATCYLEAGFCTLPLSDQFAVYDHVKGALEAPSMWTTALDLLLGCIVTTPNDAPIWA